MATDTQLGGVLVAVVFQHLRVLFVFNSFISIFLNDVKHVELSQGPN